MHSLVAQKCGDLPLRHPHIPDLDALINTASCNHAVVVLAPVRRQHLVTEEEGERLKYVYRSAIKRAGCDHAIIAFAHKSA